MNRLFFSQFLCPDLHSALDLVPPSPWRNRNIVLSIPSVRSLSGLGTMHCFFYAIAHLQLSEACLLASTTPLFIPVIAWLWIREPAARKVQEAIIMGFIGVLLILKPGTGVFRPVAMVALAAGMFAALAMVSIRRMSVSEPAIRIVFYFSALGTLGSALPLIWSWQSPRPGIWCLLILIGMMAAVGQILITRGYSLAPAAQVGPLTYGNVVFATFLGWLFWGESMGAMTWAGAVLICAAGIIATGRTKTHALLGTTAGKTTDPVSHDSD
jgi:drug/metabolite transporter (DMT)-like permease